MERHASFHRTWRFGRIVPYRQLHSPAQDSDTSRRGVHRHCTRTTIVATVTMSKFAAADRTRRVAEAFTPSQLMQLEVSRVAHSVMPLGKAGESFTIGSSEAERLLNRSEIGNAGTQDFPGSGSQESEAGDSLAFTASLHRLRKLSPVGVRRSCQPRRNHSPYFKVCSD